MDIMIDIIKFVQSFHNPFLDSFFELITMMGEEEFFIVVVASVFWCIHKEFGYKLVFAYLTNGIINTGIKEIFRVSRIIGQPGIRSLRVDTATGYSFPSGHTQLSASLWTSIMLQLKRRWIYAVGVAVILLVALSRLYLGVHTPADVLAAIFIGSAWVFVSNRVFEYAQKTGRKHVFLIFILPALVGLWFFRTDTYYKACGTLLGFCLGYLIESSYLRFEVQGVWWKQIVKVSMGMAGLLLIKTMVKAVLPKVIISDLARYFIMGVWVTVAAPLLFETLLGYSAKKQRKETSNDRHWPG